MTDEVITVMPTFTNLTELMDWCWQVRIGEIRTTPEIRYKAKVLTHARAYGREVKFNVREADLT